MPSVALLVHEDANVHVLCAYDAALIAGVKGLRCGARWNPDEEAWLVPWPAYDRLCSLLEVLGYRFVDLAKDRPLSWQEQMLDDLGANLGSRAYRNLSQALHPDTGGDHRAMAELTMAWDRWSARWAEGS